MRISIIEEKFVVCRLAKDAALPSWLNYQGYGFVSRTPEELSIVCSATMVPPDARTDAGWLCLKIDEQAPDAPFGSTRATRAELVHQLADAGVLTMSVSTYDADYLLFREANLPIVGGVIGQMTEKTT